MFVKSEYTLLYSVVTDGSVHVNNAHRLIVKHQRDVCAAVQWLQKDTFKSNALENWVGAEYQNKLVANQQ